MTIKHTTEADFRADVIDSDKPVLVDFWAAWCQPCLRMSPVLDAIDAKHADKLQIVKINVDENPQIAEQYRITGIPAFKVFQGGEVVEEFVGTRPQAVFENELSSYVG